CTRSIYYGYDGDAMDYW
nr:immunoglobulin heavy chain junction region [Mus musculus]MBK4185381.1 immunoglobulin heavy chain junction region [Mus musculus]MBK4185382.1 immunoglobulin heavy chain junction region [Mus musculus]MBK4185383.1 immunoglobulin heavy chain junction region [Mus musculus]